MAKEKRLARTVSLLAPNGEYQKYLAGEIPPKDVAEKITNPAAWEYTEGDDAVVPTGGLETMGDEEVFFAANANGTNDDVHTKKASGDFDLVDHYESMTVPQLRVAAAERDVDLSGARRKGDIIYALLEAEGSSSKKSDSAGDE